MTTTNKAAFGLSARAIDTSEFAAIYETCECLFTYDNGGSRTFVLTDSNGVDFLASKTAQTVTSSSWSWQMPTKARTTTPGRS